MDTDSWPTKTEKKKKAPLTPDNKPASTSFEVLRVAFWRIPCFCNIMEA